MKTVKIGGCSAMWGDLLGPPVDMAKRTDVNYQCFDFLAELTMSMLYRLKLRNPEMGYVTDIVPWNSALLPICRKKGIKIISNGGGTNPEAAGDALVKVGEELGMTGMKVGVVLGDDVLAQLDELRAKGLKFPNLDTGEEDIDSIKDKITAGAYVYIGADLIIEALKEGCDEVIGGRFSDNALFVGPLMYEFGWDYKEPYWNKIGAAISIGHLLECAACCTGGAMCNLWKELPEPWNVGDPIAEVDESGEAVITKTPDTGGLVNIQTIKDHLVYEIQDPKNYIMPDGIADFTTLKLEDIGENKVKVTNMTGKPRPDKLKMGIGYDAGYIIDLTIFYSWPNAFEKVRYAERNFYEWLKWANMKPLETHVDYIGINMTEGPTVQIPEYVNDLPELGLRLVARFNTREEAYTMRREAGRFTGQPAGTGFGANPPPNPRRAIGIWPTLIPREEVHTRLVIKEVK